MDYITAMTNEWYIYGSSGHGRFARAFSVAGDGGYDNLFYPSPAIQSRYLKHKQYELKDHLGNVRVVVSDFKNNNSTIHSDPPYRAEVLAAYNYYPFGMLQPGMYSENDNLRYRFGFNGMLRDDDLTDKLSTGPDEGRGNSYSTQFRQYDPRVTRWFSLDPLKMKFPWTSPYTGMGNNPVMFVDLDGRQPRTTRNQNRRQQFHHNGPQSHNLIRSTTNLQFGPRSPIRTIPINVQYLHSTGYNGTFNAVRSSSTSNSSEATAFVFQIGIRLTKNSTLTIDLGFNKKISPEGISYNPSGDNRDLLHILENAYQKDLKSFIHQRQSELISEKDGEFSFGKSNKMKIIETTAKIEFQMQMGPSPYEQFKRQAIQKENDGIIKPEPAERTPEIRQQPSNIID
jgi:RHS repeat-associated protein